MAYTAVKKATPNLSQKSAQNTTQYRNKPQSFAVVTSNGLSASSGLRAVPLFATATGLVFTGRRAAVRFANLGFSTSSYRSY